jgi:hypothetical protein
MKRVVLFSVFLVTVLLMSGGSAQNNVSQQWFFLPQTTLTKKGPMAKVGALARLHTEYTAAVARGNAASFKPSNPLLRVRNGRVVIDAVATGDVNALRTDLEALGLQNATTFSSIVSGRIPIEVIDKMATLSTLKFARPSYAITQTGSVTSQGDPAMRADDARSTFSVDGTGVTIGVLSDSFNQQGGASTDIGSRDLPAPARINVLDDTGVCVDVLTNNPTACTDEGRAMMQLIHDVAPGANLAFHTAFNGQADFASGIVELATVAGADVIVDDVIYLQEPMFQEGIVAQAVDQVKATGTSYFSAAGNAARQSYESAFNGSGEIIEIRDASGNVITSGEAHDFDPGPGVDILQSITVPLFSGVAISFQWNEPSASVSNPPGPGSKSDLEICLTNNSTPPGVIDCSTFPNTGSDPIETLIYFNLDFFGGSNFNIAILHASGPAPSLMKYVSFNLGPGVTVNQYSTESSSLFGHANATGAAAVGAAFYGSTPEFGTNPPIAEPFSAVGPTPILFDLNGNPINEVRQKPEIIAPDGTDTTFFGGTDPDGTGFPNFFGTSAAAPHAAGVAALLLQAGPSSTPDDIYTTLKSTAIDMRNPGFDFVTGYGLVQADAAINTLVTGCTPNEKPGLNCSDGVDNDCDSLTDSDDLDCQSSGTCLLPTGDADFCTLCGPCGNEQGDCDSDAECTTTLGCVNDVGALFGFPAYVDVCLNDCPLPPGDPDFCVLCGPCEHGQADCDSDAECAPGLTCENDVGATFGFGSNVDVCVDPQACPLPAGDPDFCVLCGPCGNEQGDCDSDAECTTALGCVNDVGATFGFSANVDVCLDDCAASGVTPTTDFCKSAKCGPCEHGQGDCDSDAECAPGLKCVNDVGATSGLPADWDVCMLNPPQCPLPEGDAEYCDLAQCGPCGNEQGDCDSDAECTTALGCVNDAGATFGLPANWDMCVDDCTASGVTPTTDFCKSAKCGPCRHGQGDCDKDAECAPGLKCVNDIGAKFGLPADWDVCVDPAL